jgi:DNA polymerase
MHRQDIINSGLWPSYQAYNAQDVRIMRNIYDQLAPKFPKAEWRIMDLVLRCAVQPQFVADLPRLEAHLTKVRADKEQLLASANVEKAQLMSAAAFVALLEAEGVEVETKISGTGNEIPAVAKTDRFMTDLAEHENPRVQALAAARLGFKSTIDETRTERLIAIAKLDWPMAGLPTHSMPVPLKYGGARTHRLSGDWRINMQSLPRGSLLREALTARPGFKIVVADYAQIEARIVAWFCQANVLLKAFAANQDPYLVMGGFIFDRPITKEDKLERHISKAATLGLGYGLGPDNFYLKTQAAARLQGLDLGDIWTPGLAKRTVEVYRRVNAPIKTMWRLLDDKLHHEWLGLAPPAAIGPMTIGHGYIENPYGLRMLYDNPRAEMGSELIYDYGGVPHKMWGANALENISQHLARVLVTNASIRLKQLGYSMIHQAHDELIFSVKEDEIDRALQIIHNQMVQVPSWGLGLPLGVDIGHGDNYGTAK